jgi:hypothetical protein
MSTHFDDSTPDWLKTLLIGALFAFFASVALLSETPIPYYDGNYHFKRALMFLDGDFFAQQMPRLHHSVLRHTFADLHWGYHALGAPFASMGKLPYQMLHVLFASSVGVVVYSIVSRYHSKSALYLTAILGTTPIFLQRLWMPRAIGFGILLFFIGIYLLLHRRYKWVGIFLFAFIQLYTAWIYLAYAIGLWIVVTYLTENEWAWELTYYTVGAIGAGLLVNPFFPSNIIVTWQQTIGFALIGSGVEHGVEWGPVLYKRIIWAWPLGLWAAFGLYYAETESLNREGYFWLGLTATFFVCLFLTRRFLSYFLPSIAILSGPLLASNPLSTGRRRLLHALSAVWIFMAGLSCYHEAKDFSSNTPHVVLEPCIRDLDKYFSADALIFNAHWDDFPKLYADATQRFSTGLDPRFTYLYGRDIYDKTIGIFDRENPIETLKSMNFKGIIGKKKRSKNLGQRLRDSGVEVITSRQCYLYDLREDGS